MHCQRAPERPGFPRRAAPCASPATSTRPPTGTTTRSWSPVRTAGAKVRPDTSRWQAEVEEHIRARRFDAVVESALADPDETRASSGRPVMTTGMALPRLMSLSSAQRRGAHCVFCSAALSARTAVDLGARPVDARGSSALWFPRRCATCPKDRS
ncbi:zeta toxin family protein (plasmid) [Streptomyces sp. NBC_01224]|uniref:zeta toxin family protein n=1 Tax=Streptomyces sp. NBC_01224 TaxID=2903783 RepID=UPI002E165656|nr:zeta toxin family protein [Streptomyces sp. NBC_01224]